MVDARAAALRAVVIAAREIDRLGEKEKFSGFDAMDLDRLARVCLAYDHHELTWLQKMNPERLDDELLRRVIKQAEAEDGAPRSAKRPAG